MKGKIKNFLTGLLSLMLIAVSVLPAGSMVYAEENDTSGLKFNALAVRESESGAPVADLLNGEVPSLKAGVTYTLDVEYSVPSNLQFAKTYFTLKLGDGLYIKTLPGATFNEGAIEATGFEALVKSPTGTGTSPYGYPAAGSEKSKNGVMTYQTKNSLTNVSSKGEICFALDDAYLNQDTNQILSGLIQASLSTDSAEGIDARSYDVRSEEVYAYQFYTNQETEVVSKGGTTSTLNVVNTGGNSLTEANSKTTVDIVYPSDIELVGLEEKGLYNKYGTVVATVEDGGQKTTTVEWDEPGSYSGGLSLYPHVKVPADSTRANGSSFDIFVRNFKKTIWNDTPDADRTSLTSVAKMRVTIIDGEVPEKITTHALVDSAPNWALKKYDSYNVRLGALLVKNELTAETRKKTLELDIDASDTAIIRGVTIPYHADFAYGPISWTSASGKSGEADPSILAKANVSALITNTALGLDINDSIKTIKVDLGAIPGRYDGIKPMQDLLNTWDPNNKFVNDEFYGWSYISCGVYGSWKRGTDADVVSTVKLYTTGEEPADTETHKIVGRSGAPEVLNGVGSIDKTQVMGGDAFRISGRIDDANWDWNPLQEPVLYLIMPEGFSYSNVTLTEGTLGEPTYIGEFDKDGVKVKVWKYLVDIGEETRGQYQPNFTSKDMKISFDVKTDKRAKTGTYHINDFLGITTKDFAEIGAVIKPEKWDRSNWNTKKYTESFGDKVNSGKDMVSLSERTGVMVKQAYEITAQSELLVPKTGESFIYDASTDETKTKTTPVLKNDEAAIMRVTVRNNTTTAIDHATLFIPLLNENADFGKAFMPEGKNQLPLELEGVAASSNFEIKYIKVKEAKQYALNTSPQAGDYDEVTNPAEANMLMLVSNVALAPGDGGRIDVTYKVGSGVTAAYNNAKDVITPVLDYDINGNKSTLTKEPAAVTFYTEAPETRDISVIKAWQDADGREIAAPVDKVEVELFRDGQSIAKKDITAANQWHVQFEDLVKVNPDTGKDYEYTVRETGLDKDNQIQLSGTWFTSTVSSRSDIGFAVTNAKVKSWTPMIPATTKLTATKEWEGLSQKNIEKEAVTVRLYKNGEATDQIQVLNKDNGFEATFDNLKDTDEVGATAAKNSYSVRELDLSGKAVEEAQKLSLNGREYTVHYDGAKVTNTLVNPKIALAGEKVWNDADDQDGLRPDEVTIHLYANGEDTGKTAKATEASAWKYRFDGLDTYDANGDGIQYSVKEDAAEGYTSRVDGTTITNTHTPELMNISVKKVWVGDDSVKGRRPERVRVRLYGNGEEVATYDLSSAEDWKGVFENVPKYKEGKEIKYEVKEDAVKHYAASYSKDAANYIVTNTYEPKSVFVDPPVKKVVSGNPKEAVVFTFRLKALQKDNPMPEGSRDGVKTTTITGTGSSEFGNMKFTLPGIYRYEITEINDRIENYKYDSSVYTMTITVQDVNGELTAEKTVEKSGKTEEAVFVNTYETATNPGASPKTGDDGGAAFYSLAMGVSALLFAAVLLIRRRAGARY